LLAQGEDLQAKVVACAKERAQVGEEREHAGLRIVKEKTWLPRGRRSLRCRGRRQGGGMSGTGPTSRNERDQVGYHPVSY
jgi:hypothetical protein